MRANYHWKHNLDITAYIKCILQSVRNYILLTIDRQINRIALCFNFMTILMSLRLYTFYSRSPHRECENNSENYQSSIYIVEIAKNYRNGSVYKTSSVYTHHKYDLIDFPLRFSHSLFTKVHYFYCIFGHSLCCIVYH